MVFAVVELFLIFFSHRGSLFGRGSPKMLDADLRRLYTATSLMQIDDNIMRCACCVVHSRRSCVAQRPFIYIKKKDESIFTIRIFNTLYI